MKSSKNGRNTSERPDSFADGTVWKGDVEHRTANKTNPDTVQNIMRFVTMKQGVR